MGQYGHLPRSTLSRNARQCALTPRRKRVHNADEIMAEIVVQRLVAHPERAKFVVMKS
jgi:hypothetical protein